MELREGYDSAWLNRMLEIYNATEMKRPDGAVVDTAFKNSFAVISYWSDEILIGIGRMISDGIMYANIYDVVIDPKFQKQGMGKKMMLALMAKTPHATIHLTSTLGNEAFYISLGFRRHRTAMSFYPVTAHPSCYLDYEWKSAT